MKAGYLLLRFLKFLSLVFFIGFLFIAYYYLPPQVAIHYNISGIADQYASKEMVCYAFGGFAILFNTALSLLNRIIYSVPAKLFAMPNRNYWLADRDNQQGFHEILHDWLSSLIVLVNSFLFLCLYILYTINTSTEKTAADYAWLLNAGLFVLIAWIIFLPVRLLIKKNGLLD